MATVGDLVARERRSNQTAFESPTTTYDYRQFCTLAHKTGNYMSYFGARIESEISVFTGNSMSAAPVLTLFGGSLLGATVAFNPAEYRAPRVVVAPAERIETGLVPETPGMSIIAFDGDVDEPSVHSFGRGTWSENPACPQDPRISSETKLIRDGESTYTHGEIVRVAKSLAADYEISTSDRVVLRTPISSVASIICGIVMPIMVGAAIVYADPDLECAAGSVAIGDGDSPEPITIEPTTISK